MVLHFSENGRAGDALLGFQVLLLLAKFVHQSYSAPVPRLQSESIVARHMEKVYKTNTYIMRTVMGYAYWSNGVAEVRRHYLLCVLLASGSSFRDFTHYCNGFYGNMTRTVDIIDHIVSYIVGECDDRVVNSSLGIIHKKTLYYHAN